MHYSYMSDADFITEGEDMEQAAAAAKGPIIAQSLGPGLSVPRCLRWRDAEEIELLPMTLEETEAMCADVWRVRDIETFKFTNNAVDNCIRVSDSAATP